MRLSESQLKRIIKEETYKKEEDLRRLIKNAVRKKGIMTWEEVALDCLGIMNYYQLQSIANIFNVNSEEDEKSDW